jgi:carboxymethylenebutenolidase
VSSGSKIIECDEKMPVGGGIEVAAHLAMPDDAAGKPVVILLGEIWGVNAQIRALCRRLAEAGVCVVAPDQYRGITPPSESDPQQTVLGFFDRFDDPAGIRDARACLDWVLGGGLGVTPGPVYALGFCMGGRFAHYLAAFDPRLSGAVNFYGRLDFAKQPHLKPFTPLDVAGLIEAPYLGLFGSIDDFIPDSDVELLRQEFSARGTPHHLHVYEGAHHAFFNETRASYDPAAAADAWKRLVGFVRDGRLP